MRTEVIVVRVALFCKECGEQFKKGYTLNGKKAFFECYKPSPLIVNY